MFTHSQIGTRVLAAVSSIAFSAVFMATAIIPASPNLIA